MGVSKVTVKADEVRVGRRFAVTFQRTLRIPDDGRVYPLPPGLGRLPVLRVADHAARVPAEWRRRGGVIIPLYQREALWLAFDAAEWKPNAVQVAAGGVNAVSGGAWAEGLSDDPQNYLVCPDQLWLDGINAGGGLVRQFVAVPLGAGLTVEAQLTGAEEVGGLQVRVYEPKPGRFPDRAPRRAASSGTLDATQFIAPRASAGAMGLGAGGRAHQKIYPDPYGLDTWDADAHAEVYVHIINSRQYRELTGRPAPPTPISARTYTERGFPWFDLYDEERATVESRGRLSKARSLRELDEKAGRAGDDDRPVKIDPSRVKKIKRT